MDNTYRCYDVEVSVAGMDVMLDGTIERVCTGLDDEGCEKYETIVCAERVYPIVLVHGRVEEVSEHPLASYPIEWRDELVRAIEEQAEADHERRVEAAGGW